MRLIIVSNRLPVNIVKTENGYRYEASSGGLASGLGAFVDKIKKDKTSKMEVSWVGWPGTVVDDKEKIRKEILNKFGAHCVFLSDEDMEKFYEGFCNKTIWPLFHYFPAYTSYENENWEQYVSVNEIFCKALIPVIRPGDLIWVHDYHLMLLPAMLRKKFPAAAIGFFLHIPFPSYEVFRLIPSTWRKEIMDGIYGADLIGFHTHDYATYFLRSTQRILGNPNHMGEVLMDNRLVKVDNFPMGIDYAKYNSAIKARKTGVEIKKLMRSFAGFKIVLSIDRQDYTKGILNRLRGYEYFLKIHPEWIEKICLIMIVVPSRIGVENYVSIKDQIDQLVGNINGKYGNLNWTPVLYQYHSISFHELIALYNKASIALVTPLRDGMNLVAKEFIAARSGKSGVLILSEMAGAADELAESIIINPNNIEEIAGAIAKACNMPVKEQAGHLKVMQKRIQAYDVFHWAGDFISSLKAIKEKQERLSAKKLNSSERNKILGSFKKAATRTLFLDYDGTLTPYAGHPEDAIPGKELIRLLRRLSHLDNTSLVIISGRDRKTLEKWFGHLPVSLVAEHGLFIKEQSGHWQLLRPIRKNWKKKVIPILLSYTDKLPGSFIEEKEYSLVFHYRNAEPELASLRVKELTDHLVNFTANMDVKVLNGSKALELKNAGVEKGVAALHWLSKKTRKPHFTLSVGDDVTDEDLFRVMPENAFSIKVGQAPSYAKYNLYNSSEVLDLLNRLGK
jgi:trehalose 6-phosphate synthase/phosphatase